jgi:hypothetical protein
MSTRMLIHRLSFCGMFGTRFTAQIILVTMRVDWNSLLIWTVSQLHGTIITNIVNLLISPIKTERSNNEFYKRIKLG